MTKTFEDRSDLPYRGYMIRKYQMRSEAAWWVEKEGFTISHYAGSVDIAKRQIDELVD